MRNPRIYLALFLFIGLPTHATEQEVELREHVQIQEHLHLIEQPKPEFPKSEFTRGREGWVLLAYDVLEDGTVVVG